MEPTTIGLVGVGGYAGAYLRVIDLLEKEGVMRFHAAVVRNPAKYPDLSKSLRERGVLLRPSLEDMLARDARDLDLVGIPTGIADHSDMLIKTVEAGCDVVLEKPTTATIQEADAMIAALQGAGRFCQIGYQNQARATVKALKRLICDGKLGRIRSVAVHCCEYRRDSYYERNPWAGKLRDERGRYILDGGLNNPFSHQLMNALYFARDEWMKIATPIRVRAELYHGHDIESEDTACAEVETAEGVTVHFFSSLCAHAHGPIHIEVVGDKGAATWWARGGRAVEIRYADGTEGAIDDPKDDMSLNLMRNAMLFKRGEATELDCALPMTRSVVLATDGVFLSAGKPLAIAKEHLNIYHDEKANSRAVEIADIEAILDRAFAERKLYSDLGVPWARATKPVDVAGLKTFAMAE